MKKATVLLLCTFLFIAVSSERSTAGNVKSAGVKGNWSAPATWATGVLPSAADTAIVADGDTVLYDMTWAVGDTIAKLVIGEGAPAVLRFPKTDSTKLLIKGGLWIRSGASLRAQTATVAPGLQHLITIGGDFLCDGIMDARIGSAGSTMGVINFEFTGSTNSNITFSNKDSVTIATANYEFNGMKINKSGNANVYLGSNIIFASGSSTDAYRNVNVVFAKGKVFTGNYVLITTSTTGATLPAGSDTTGYIVGAMGRGTSSGGGTREYYVGDAKAYRPITVNTTIGNGANGNYVIVRLISGNGNSLCGTYGSGIDKVSTGRYYQVTWNKGTTTTTSMKFGFFSPSYRDDDGVVAGSVNLRAAILDTSKTSWTNLGPTTAVYTTMMDSLPRRLNTDTLASANNITLVSGGAPVSIALSRKAGTTDNSLIAAANVERISSVPSAFALSQNYPNPFNPSTRFTYQLGGSGFVSVKIYDVLGREVATLVNEVQQAGTYAATWNATGNGSGIYFCTLQAGAFSETKKMLLMK